MAVATETRTCAKCGRHFEALSAEVKRGKAKYCSRQCGFAGRTFWISLNCEFCGKAYKSHPDRAIQSEGNFCSAVCKNSVVAKVFIRKSGRNISVVKNVCHCCQKEFDAPISDVKRGKLHYCSQSCASKCRHANREGLNIGTPLGRTSCPVTVAKLRDMYWKEGKSAREIASQLKVSRPTVARWLTLAGITLRTKSEAARLMFKVQPHLRDVVRQNLARRKSEGKWHYVPSKNLNQSLRKARAAWKKKCKQARVLRECSLPGCKNTFEVRPYRNSGRRYCSRSCFGKHNIQLRMEAKEQLALKTRAEAMLGMSL